MVAVAVDDHKPLVSEYFDASTRRVAVGLAIAAPFFAFVLHSYAAEEGGSPWIVLPFDIFALVMTALWTIPMIRLTARPTPTSLIIRNKWWKSYEFTWSQIDEIAFGLPDAPLLDQVAVVVLKDGERVPIHSLYAPNQFTRPGNDSAQLKTSELQRAKDIADHNQGVIPNEYFEC